ncbi:MAG TPA: ABC transporter ATP-binding protein [Candidatus Dormibacteraeota bacterium]|nr:ABC transporter ATP-binding protein [Candidatus Dormibacteraeota bacterium]
MSVLNLEEVSRDYQIGRERVGALKGVCLRVDPGEFLAVVGPSGSGKTTLLNLAGCIDRPTSGRVTLDGQRCDDLPEGALSALRAEKIGFVFQTFNLIPVLTAAENVEYPLLLRPKVPPLRERRKRVAEMLERTGISALARRRPDEMSGGERQRVAIARALVGRPSLVLADEATANLDGETAAQIVGLMRELNERQGVTFVFSTHDSRLQGMAKRVVELRDGLLHGGRGC